MSNEPLPADDRSQESRRAELLADQIDAICDGFEAAWRAGQEPQIEQFLGKLTGDAAAQRQLLIELVRTDLHWRWERVGRQRGAAAQATETLDADGGVAASGRSAVDLLRLEDYVVRFPLLGPADELPPDLIAAEYRERQNAGERPDPAEYEQRFPRQLEAVAEQLARIDAALAAANVCPPAGPTVGTRVRYFGDYELLEEIARGGMGVVYKARQVSLNRIVGLKMILAGQLAGEEEVRRFHAEAEAAANLDHPGIVPIYEVGEHEGQHFFSMGYVEGESLAKRLADGPLPPREAVRLMAQVAKAVAYAHSKGVIHRDLKPANILLASGGRQPAGGAEPSGDSRPPLAEIAPRITDFGLAKRVTGESGLTATGQVLGTPSYMPPEQAAGKLDEIKETADVYSLGATLYALLSGRPPFQADNPLDTLLQVLHAEPVSLRQLNAKLPRDLETICQKCLQKEPRRRYATAHEFADELRRYLEGKPILARPIGRAARTWRWCQRNPVVAGLTAAVAATLMLGTVISTGFALRASAQSQRADAKAQESDENAKRAEAKAREARHEKRRADEKAAEALAAAERADAKATEARANLYATEMKAAQTYWEACQMQPLLELLRRWEPQDDEPDLRGWEWFYQWRLCHAELRSLTGKLILYDRVAFSPDGQQLAASGTNGTTLWNASTGQELHSLTHSYCLGSPFSPDGRRLATRSFDQAVEVWDVATGQKLLTFKGHSGRVLWVAFSSDGKRVLCAADTPGGEDARVHSVDLWDALSSQKITTLGGLEPQQQLSFGPDARWTAVVLNNTMSLRNLTAGNGDVPRILQGHTQGVTKVTFSPDGKVIASASIDGTAKLWDSSTSLELRTLRGHTNTVSSVAFSPAGERLCSAGLDGRVIVWDVATGETLGMLQGHTGQVADVSFSPDGRRIASVGYDGVKLWNAGGTQEVRKLPIRAAQVSPDGRLLAMPVEDHRIKLWDLTTGKELPTLFSKRGPERSSPNSARRSGKVFFSPDGRRLASAARDGSAKLWDLTTGQELRTLPIPAGDSVTGMAFSPNGKWLAAGVITAERCCTGIVKLWDVPTGRELRTLKACVLPPTEQHQASALGAFGYFDDSGVVFSPDSRRLAWADCGGGVRVWDMSTEQEVHRVQGDKSPTVRLTFSPSGCLLAACCEDGTVKLWDSKTWKPLRKLAGRAQGYWTLAFSADGRRLISGNADNSNSVAIWDVATGHELRRLKVDRSSAIINVAFTADNHWLVATQKDGSVRLWDARPLTPELRLELEGRGVAEFFSGQSLSGEEVAARIRQDGTITDTVRQRALEFVPCYWALDPRAGSGTEEARSPLPTDTTEFNPPVAAPAAGGASARPWQLQTLMTRDGGEPTQSAPQGGPTPAKTTPPGPAYKRTEAEPVVREPRAKPGQGALRFTKDMHEASAMNSDTLDLRGPLTVEAWIRPDPGMLGNELNFVISKNLEGTGYCLLVLRNRSIPSIQFEVGNGSLPVHAGLKERFDEWTHVAGVWDQGISKLYVDGKLKASVATAGSPKTNKLPLRIGSSPFGTQTRFWGAIDEVRIWSVARTDAQIRESMRRKLTGKEPGLAACWDFDGTQEDCVHDLSGHTNTLVLGAGDHCPEWVEGVVLAPAEQSGAKN